MRKTYDYIIVGSGLFGSVFANEAIKRGKMCLVIERRSHVGGNVYCLQKEGINIHCYGAHIFHTNNEVIWRYINQFAAFNQYINSPVANYRGELYNLPFNMNTFNKIWGVVTPKEAEAKIEEQRRVVKGIPQNLEEQAISLVGVDIYEKLIKGYTEKQWGRNCKSLPAFIIKRIPVRYTYDNNYFYDRFQGIPSGGYNAIIDKLLSGSDIKLNVDYNSAREDFAGMAKKVLYTGPIDEYFHYIFGQLEYRGLKFETERLAVENYQGVAVMDYTSSEVPYTRSIEHKHFEFGKQPVTYVTKEYPYEWKKGDEAYYPVNDGKNQQLYQQYEMLARRTHNVIFGGRLAEYQYYDMDKVIERALNLAKVELQ